MIGIIASSITAAVEADAIVVVPPTGDAFSRWRVLFLENVGGPTQNYALTELAFLSDRLSDGGVDLSTGGVAVSSGMAEGTASDWFNDQYNFNSWVATQYPNPTWMEYQFTEPVVVATVGFYAQNGQTPGWATKAALQYWDGTQWVTKFEGFTGITAHGQYRELSAPVPASAHRYWQISVDQVNGASGWDPGEVEFIDQIGQRRYPPNPMTDLYFTSEYPGDNWYKAFDNNPGSRAGTDFSGTWPQRIAVDFHADVTIYKIRIWGGENASRSPRAFSVRFSDDNIEWTTAVSYSEISGTNQFAYKEHEVFPPEVLPLEAHRYWRVRANQLNGDTGWDIQNFSLLNDAGVRMTDGVSTASSTFSGFNAAALLAALGGGSRWASDFSGTYPQDIFVDFGAGNEKTVKALTIDAATSAGRMMTTGNLAYSDNGTEWTPVRGWNVAVSTPTTTYFDERGIP